VSPTTAAVTWRVSGDGQRPLYRGDAAAGVIEDPAGHAQADEECVDLVRAAGELDHRLAARALQHAAAELGEAQVHRGVAGLDPGNEQLPLHMLATGQFADLDHIDQLGRLFDDLLHHEVFGEYHQRQPRSIHVVGGGARNELLCSWTASASGLPVLAGPDEATVLGNLLVQAMAAGEISSLGEGREIVRASFEPTLYEPDEKPEWDEARGRFAAIVAGRSLEVSA